MNNKNVETVVKLDVSLDLGALRSVFVSKFRKQNLEQILDGKFTIQTDFSNMYVEVDNLGAKIFYSINDYHSNVYAQLYVPHVPTLTKDRYTFDYQITKIREPKEYRKLPNYTDDVLLMYKSIVLLFMEDMDKIPKSKTRYTTKKKKKKTINQYMVTDEFLEDEILFNNISNVDEKNILNIPQIITSVKRTEELDNIFRDHVSEKILVPFMNFVIRVKDKMDIVCKLEEKQLLYKAIVCGKNLVDGIIYLDTYCVNKHGEAEYDYIYRINYEPHDQKQDQQKLIANIIFIILVNLYFMTHYNIRKEVIHKFAKEDKNQEVGITSTYSKDTTTKSSKDDNDTKIVDMTKPQRVYKYFIDDYKNPNKKLIKRKSPKYVKCEWAREGHYRHLKNGRVIYIDATTCKRHKEITEKNIKYLIDKE